MNIAYCLNPNVDWTNPEKQSIWESYGRRVGRFLSEEYPLTRDELTVLCRAYAVQHDEPENKSLRTYDLEYELLVLFENGIVIVMEWWPLKY